MYRVNCINSAAKKFVGRKSFLIALAAAVLVCFSFFSSSINRTSSKVSASVPPFKSTGFFHTYFNGKRWWIVSPDGYPFYINGVDHVSASPDVDQKTGLCPYCQTVAADYPSMSAWENDTVGRLHAWGFNTLGPWSDSTLYPKMPYTVLLSMASGSDWFASSFVANAYNQANSTVSQYKNDPNLVGFFTDSELRWGPDWTNQNDLLSLYLNLPPGSPGRVVATKYAHDPNGFETALATRYFSVTTAAIRSVDPNHMILGVKMIAQLCPVQVLKVAAKYINAFSVDDYALVPGLNSFIQKAWPTYPNVKYSLTSIYDQIKIPIIVGEYSFRANGGLNPNTWPPIYPTYSDQMTRSQAYESYVQHLYQEPFVVGDFWFEYTDEPQGGRFDGENSDFGIVATNDVPWSIFVTAVTNEHSLSPGIEANPLNQCWLYAVKGSNTYCALKPPKCPGTFIQPVSNWPYCKIVKP